MPVLENPVLTRLEILKTLYRLSEQQEGRIVPLDPALIDGGYHSEIKYQLRFLQDRGFVTFSGSPVSRRFRASLTPAGVSFIEGAYAALRLPQQEKDAALDALFRSIR